MNCKSVQNRLSAYLDRELGGDELLQIRAHMSVCRECREEADGLRALKALLGGIRCPEPPENLAERLTANTLRHRLDKSSTGLRVSALMLAGVTACSMLATLMVLSFGSDNGFARQAQSAYGPGVSTPIHDGAFGGDGFGSGPVLSAANFGPR